jgi:hypothetical protein
MMTTLYAPLVVGAGATANLLFAAMFVTRVVAPRWSRPLGFVGTGMAVPLAAASLMALAAGAGIWLIVLPAVFVVFALVEVYVDVMADVEVRTTRWLGPYLAVFYLAQWAVVGAAFLTSSSGGATVLATYFGCLATTAWSYRKVGHGNRSDSGRQRVPG